MDLPSRKIEFIQEFLELNSEEVISKFESLLRKEKSRLSNPFDRDELIKRVKQSEADFKENRFKTSEELLRKYQS